MSKKAAKIPDSDTSVRAPLTELEMDVNEDAGNTAGREVSNKSGKHSSVVKEAASRPGRGTGTQAKKTAGAFGKPGRRTNRPGSAG